MENVARGNAAVVKVDAEEAVEEVDVATGPARTRADHDRTPDPQRSEASRRRDARRVVRSTGSDAPEVGPSRSTKEDTPSTAKIAAGKNVVTITGASTVTIGNDRRATVRTTLVIAAVVAVAATAVECVVAGVPVTEVTTRAVVTVASVATWPSKGRISTATRAWSTTTITIRRWLWAVAFRRITTELLRWWPDRPVEVTTRFQCSNSSSSSK